MLLIKKLIIFILTLESRLILKKYRPFVIAVTGSVGKTSTKDAIYSVLKKGKGYVRKSQKSMNSDIGLPLTIIGVPNAWRSLSGWMSNVSHGLRLIMFRQEYPDCLIVEVGADHPGDISKVARWLRPDIAVITKVSDTPVHVEFFVSPADVFTEKASLAKAVKKGGTLVLYADDPKVAGLATLAPQLGAKVITFGTSAQSEVRGTDVKVSYNGGPTGFSFTADIKGTSSPVSVNGILGETYLYPLLAAAAVATVRGLAHTDIIDGMNGYEAPKGRMSIVPGMNGSTIIDDSYNSSPDAALSGLVTLRNLETSGAKIAILGDMMELGKYSAEEHRKVGKQVSFAATRLITVGPRARAIADEALQNSMPKAMVSMFDTADEAAAFVPTIIGAGDIVLIKGSQSIRLERVVKALMKEPEKAGDMLVRQEKEWLEKV